MCWVITIMIPSPNTIITNHRYLLIKLRKYQGHSYAQIVDQVLVSNASGVEEAVTRHTIYYLDKDLNSLILFTSTRLLSINRLKSDKRSELDNHRPTEPVTSIGASASSAASTSPDHRQSQTPACHRGQGASAQAQRRAARRAGGGTWAGGDRRLFTAPVPRRAIARAGPERERCTPRDAMQRAAPRPA